MTDTNIDELMQYLENECIQAHDVYFDREKAKAQIKQLITKELQTIADIGYDGMNQTYDYDAVAEALLERLAALQGEE